MHNLELSAGEPVDSPSDVGKVYRVMATSANAVRVGPGDPPPTAAVQFSAASYERMVVENAEVNSIVGFPIMATGAMPLKYDLDATETNDDAYFTVDNHGQIRVGEVAFPDVLAAGVMAVPDGATVPVMDDPELDFEGTNAFVLIVTATDTSDDTRKATARVSVRLNDLNERPYFDQESREAVMGDNSPIMYAESRSNRVVPLAATEPDGDSLRWEVTGADASAFEIRDAQDIASDGKDRVELHFKEQPDFEARGGGADKIYNVMVRATETTAMGGGPNMAATLPVMVQVTNSDEDGAVELNWLQPEVGTEITASVSDPDGEVTGPIWTWYRSKNQSPNRDPGTEVTDLTQEWELITGQANAAAYTPQGKDASEAPPSGNAVDETWFLLARVEYTDAEGENKAAVGISANPVQPDVSDADNNSPDYNLNETNRTVPESASKGTHVGRPVVVNRNEDNDILTYQLDDNNDAEDGLGTTGDVGRFSINRATGQITVNGELDWDDNPDRTNPDGKYEIWVRATDPSGEPDGENNDGIKVIITATDVNEEPSVTAPGMAELSELSVNEVDSSKKDDDVTKYVGLGYELTDGDPPVKQLIADNPPNLYHREDDDNVDAANWSISGPDGGLFEYSTPGDGIGRRLHFKKANLPDYEKPQDANRDNVYEVMIVADDNRNARGTKNVRITVMNVNEMGKLVMKPEQPDDGMPVMARLTDPDGVESITDVKWASANSRAFTSFGDATLMPSATTLEIPGKGQVGNFLWAMVDYRDGYSMENDPVIALDERNDGPGTDGIFGTGDDAPIETRKLVGNVVDTLFYNSDEMESAVTDNAVQTDPTGGTLPGQMPSTEPILMDRMVYENVPSTGYVGIPLDMLGTRDMIGGPDGASFVFAEDMDDSVDRGFYDSVLVGSDAPDDKLGQLAAAVVTHFNAEGDKREYIIEVTDPDAEVAMGPVRVTITVMNVNEPPTAPMEQRGGLSVTGRENVMFDEILADNTSPDLMVGTYRGIGVDAANAVWSLSGLDMGDFTIDAITGELMFNMAPNYEMPMDADMDNEYQITVEANDGTNTATLPMTVMVANVDEMGRVTFWRDGADTTDAAIMAGDMLGGAVEDPDGNVGDTPPITDMYTTINGATWQWAKTMTPDMMASWMDITGATDAAYTVKDADGGYHLRATAMYADGEGMGKMASEETMMVMMMTMNAAPEFADSEDGARSVAENTAAGEYIGTPVAGHRQ